MEKRVRLGEEELERLSRDASFCSKTVAWVLFLSQ
jgi:hypothetical protein